LQKINKKPLIYNTIKVQMDVLRIKFNKNNQFKIWANAKHLGISIYFIIDGAEKFSANVTFMHLIRY
jgi:hypothetical protein